MPAIQWPPHIQNETGDGEKCVLNHYECQPLVEWRRELYMSTISSFYQINLNGWTTIDIWWWPIARRGRGIGMERAHGVNSVVSIGSTHHGVSKTNIYSVEFCIENYLHNIPRINIFVFYHATGSFIRNKRWYTWTPSPYIYSKFYNRNRIVRIL